MAGAENAEMDVIHPQMINALACNILLFIEILAAVFMETLGLHY